MGIAIRAMRPGQEDAVAAMLRQLPKDIGLDVVPKVTGQSLRDNQHLAHVTVAEDSGLLLGCCLWVMSYSSWRGAPGIYVGDIYVMEHARHRKIGDRLLRGVIKDANAKGATFIKLEVDVANTSARGFYQRRGFQFKPDDQLFVLEPEDFEILLKGTST